MQTPTVLVPLQSPARPVFEEDFPPGVVHRIVRHMSSTPRAERWTCNVSSVTVHALFLTSGQFPAAAASIFDTVTTVSSSFSSDAPPVSRGAVLSVTSDAD